MQTEPIDKITIEGYKSIRSLKDFQLHDLNVFIGANGAGKSNFVGFFKLVQEILKQRLAFSVNYSGGADRLLFNGPKETNIIHG